MTNSLSQPYKSKDFKIFLWFASGTVTMLGIAACNPNNIMEAARLELAFRRINTVSLPINLRIHMVMGFKHQPIRSKSINLHSNLVLRLLEPHPVFCMPRLGLLIATLISRP